jgi:hypothetical protein
VKNINVNFIWVREVFFLGQTREVRRNYLLTYIQGPIHNMKGKKDPYLHPSEGPNVEMKSRREDKQARLREEKGGAARKTLFGPGEENRLSFQPQKGS